MSYIKEKYFNHIVVLGDIDNNEPEYLYGTIIFSGGKKYVIDDFYVTNDGSEIITDVCVIVTDESGNESYEHIERIPFVEIVVNAENVILPEYEYHED